jgi:hypothetical protein
MEAVQSAHEAVEVGRSVTAARRSNREKRGTWSLFPVSRWRVSWITPLVAQWKLKRSAANRFLRRCSSTPARGESGSGRP